MTSIAREPTRELQQLLQERRGWAARLVEDARYLDPSDAALLRSVYDHGMSATQLARAVGAKPYALQRRLRRIVQRMTSPEFRYVLRHRRTWPDQRRKIVEAVFLRGEGQRPTAATCGVTVHRVRQEIDRVRLAVEFERAQRAAG
ncbi:MAG: hypothetical protein EA377_07970 [Phycisphaerales bacterium]|nr:MAG: hypothetical protein EA377_07970 [Phycisphaerales bacterium]